MTEKPTKTVAAKNVAKSKPAMFGYGAFGMIPVINLLNAASPECGAFLQRLFFGV